MIAQEEGFVNRFCRKFPVPWGMGAGGFPAARVVNGIAGGKPAERSRTESEEIPTRAQFSPRGGKVTVVGIKKSLRLSSLVLRLPSVFPSVRKPAERSRTESEEIPTRAQFSPRGGNGAVVGISELVRPTRFERATYRVGVCHSIQLSYGRVFMQDLELAACPAPKALP